CDLRQIQGISRALGTRRGARSASANVGLGLGACRAFAKGKGLDRSPPSRVTFTSLSLRSPPWTRAASCTRPLRCEGSAAAPLEHSSHVLIGRKKTAEKDEHGTANGNGNAERKQLPPPNDRWVAMRDRETLGGDIAERLLELAAAVVR